MNSYPFKFLAASVVAMVACAPLSALADTGWNCRTVRVIVPYAAGGGTDAVARIVATKLGEQLKETVIVDNRPGGKSVIAYQELLRAGADGCAILLNNSSHSIQPLYKNLPYDAVKDFRAVSVVALGPTMLVTSASFPATNLKEFIEQAKKTKINYGSYGVGTTSHLDGEMLSANASVTMVHVPYRGSAPALTDLMGGQIQALFVDGLSARPLIKAGKIRGIAAIGQARWKSFPDLPTFGELGYADLSNPGWWGIFASSKVDPATVAQMAAALKKVAADPDTVRKMQEVGAEAYANDPVKFATDVAAEVVRWRSIVDKRHIALE